MDRRREVLVQDRYAGDVGDFGKYGLLRWLCRADGSEPALRLGVLWYRFDDATPGDGRYVSYLKPPLDEEFRRCDPDLFEKMYSVVHGKRSVAGVEASGVLPADTAFFGRKLVFRPADARASKRRNWLEAGRRAVEHADVVFADPDNGLEIDSVGPLSAKGPKYVYYDDLRPCWKRGQSLVIYQHIARHVSAEEQVAARHAALREHFNGAQGAFELRWRRFSSRVYFVIPAANHAERLAARRRSLLGSHWRRHFT